MSKYINPPIGVSPHWYVYNKRIKAVNEAIARYIDFASEHGLTIDTISYYELIAKWATEIKMLAEIEAQLLREDKKELQNG